MIYNKHDKNEASFGSELSNIVLQTPGKPSWLTESEGTSHSSVLISCLRPMLTAVSDVAVLLEEAFAQIDLLI